MTVERYIEEKHGKLLDEWLGVRGIRGDRRLMSDFGLVVDGVVIGFLFKGGNSKIAEIDNFVSDPKAPSEKKDAAIRELINQLELEAARGGFLVAKILVALDTMIRRVEDAGYQKQGAYRLYFKPLEGF